MHVYDMRLVQAGIVPTTLRQILYEWISGEQEIERRTKMIELLASIDQQF